MATEKTKRAAKHIIEDRHGADYYKNTKELANYLKNTLSLITEKAEEKAEVIQRDRKGANYYEDVEILSNFLKPVQKNLFQQKLSELTKLYTDSTLIELLNDTVAIGTWPTPEKPELEKHLTERSKKLKKLIGELIKNEW